jgi:hypothetical protein
MRKLDTSLISATNGFPIKSGTLDFIQDSYTEIVGELISALINSGVGYVFYVPYVLYGCEKSSTGGNTTISAGAIFWNGEVFVSPSQTFPDPSGGDVIIANIGITQYSTNADPVTFSLGSAANVHNIRRVLYSTGTSGTGTLGNYDTDFIKVFGWKDGGTDFSTAVVDSGSVTISSGDVISNKYKIINSDTLIWELHLKTFTISGSPFIISLPIPPELVSSGLKLRYGYFNFFGLYNGSLPLKYGVLVAFNSKQSVSDDGFIDITLAGFSFTAGVNNQEVILSITAELQRV